MSLLQLLPLPVPLLPQGAGRGPQQQANQGQVDDDLHHQVVPDLGHVQGGMANDDSGIQLIPEYDFN